MAKKKDSAAEGFTDEQRAYVESGGSADVPAVTETEEGAKPKRQRRDIPEELRPYHVLFGQPTDGRPLQRIGRYKSRVRAERFVQEAGELLRNNFSAVEIVQCRRKAWIDLR